MNPSRTGKLWSKYRCHCGAMVSRSCMCGDLSRDDGKRVTFKELEHRNLSGLFSISSGSRVRSPLPHAWKNYNLFKG